MTHFAGFHIGLCIGNGWIAGRSAAEDTRGRDVPVLDTVELARHREAALRPLDSSAGAASDRLLKDLQALMFRYDVTVLKDAHRLDGALVRLDELRQRARQLRAPDPHELVRLKELEAMLQAAELILRASRLRTESRLSHMREDFPARDDEHWLKWIDLSQHDGRLTWTQTRIPTPLVPAPRRAPVGSAGMAMKGEEA